MKCAKIYLYLAWLLACIMTLGSLYVSLVTHREPCTLCWYQRICTFPLTIFLAVALYKNFLAVLPYVALFPLGGLLISSFHIALQEIPGFRPFKVCSSSVSCAIKEAIGLGPITPPMLTFLGSFLILLFLVLSARCYRRSR